MGLLDGKNALIFGVANKNSIAWGIAQSLHREGANLAFSYGLDKLERRVTPLAEEVGSNFVELCDVSSDEQLDNLFEKYKNKIGTIDILVHSVAFAPTEELSGRYSDISREGFHLTMDISAYSLIAMAKRARDLMPNGGCIVAMTYYAAEKVIPRYNAMAVAKAALEISVKYLAYDLGPDGIRVNAISAGPIKTLAASAIGGFRKLMNGVELVAPLRRLVTQDEVGDACVWLVSDWGRSVTGEIVHVDAGYNILGMTAPEDVLED
ncbi:MAG TPA: enoyl-ACP reductase [Aggregatilineales bacterium]|nr:enoyl-ACP reductase [Aggregatilineales bacterium]